MIVFELTMPHAASWNGRWSGEGRRYIRARDERTVPREVWDRNFYYRWDDGWEAMVAVQRMSAREAAKLLRVSSGSFCGYDWMITSIIDHGFITTRKERDL